MFWTITCLLASAIASPPPPPAACPAAKPVENFEFKRFFSGKWFEISRYDNFDLEIDADCTFGEYTHNNDVFNVTLYDVIDGKMKSFSGEVKLSPGAGNLGKIEYTFPRYANGKYPLLILATDYDNYGVLYNCFYDKDRKSIRELAWIMSRTTVMPKDAQASLDSFINTTHIIDLKNVVWEHFTKESCLFDI